jgi:hypothetical protein
VLTNAAGGGNTIGNICGTTPQNPLTNSWEIPLNNFNYVFTTPSGGNAFVNTVGIGTNCNPSGKLHVINTRSTLSQGQSIAGFFENNSTDLLTVSNYALNYGVWGTSNSVVPFLVNGAVPSINTGIRGDAANNKNNIGVFGNVSNSANAAQNIGGRFQTNIPSSVQAINYGVVANVVADNMSGINTAGLFKSNRGANNYGTYSDAADGSFNYAVYANAQPPTGTDILTNNNYAGFFNGGVYISQTINPSDELMKKDMIKIPDALTRLNQLEAISFKFDQDLANTKGLSLPANTQYGFKAQQVASLFPDLVSGVRKPEEYDTTGAISKPAYDFKGVNYIGFIALLTRGVQQQQSIIDSLQHTNHVKDSIQDARLDQQDSLIQQLMNMINACCQSAQNRGINNNTTGVVQMNIELGDKDAIVLNQNVPNPFAEQTIITYNIPEKTGFAQILFSDMKGQIIKVVDIKIKGKGQLNVFANDLSTGMYTYSLYVDGKLFETKKMVKTE